MTTVLKVNPQHPSPRAIARAAAILRAGGVVAYPTDTVYGLGANVWNPSAVRKIFAVKRRPLDQPLPVAVAGRAMASEVAYVDARAARVVDQFWPGPLTLVLLKTPRLPLVVTGGRVGVGVRAPNHPVPLALLASTQGPLIATSANIHGSPPCVDADEVRTHLAGAVDLILDGGTCNAPPSTVLDLTGDTPILRRRGAISRRRLEVVLGGVVDAASSLE
jgi:L-threonylcarbamoyladenylate synthase